MLLYYDLKPLDEYTQAEIYKVFITIYEVCL